MIPLLSLHSTARRLEALTAEENRLFVEAWARLAPEDGSVSQAVAGGLCVFTSRAEVVATGFTEGSDPGRIGLLLALANATTPGARTYLATVDGEPAAGAAVSVRGEQAFLVGDATLPGFRGRGLQSALLRSRLRAAEAAGCRMAVAGVSPGGASHRNFERHGFLVAYTSITLIKHPPERRPS